jgi:hypothetical protein
LLIFIPVILICLHQEQIEYSDTNKSLDEFIKPMEIFFKPLKKQSNWALSTTLDLFKPLNLTQSSATKN